MAADAASLSRPWIGRSRHRRAIVLLAAGAVLIAVVLAVKAAIFYRERRYLDEALQIVQRSSVRRRDTNWAVLREHAYERQRSALTRHETYDTVRFVLSALGDHHSGLVVPEMVAMLRKVTAHENPPPEGKLLPGRLGYVRVPPFVSANQGAIDDAATRLQRIVQEVDAGHPCAWLVDLQNNSGGNMWPMLAGLGPILGDGPLGAFIDPDGHRLEWSYADGAAAEARRSRAHVIGAGYTSDAATAPVVVLISHATASSGEAVAIAFIGRARTRLVGQHTPGLTTSNDQFLLSDGAMLNLSVAAFADRHGRVYPGGVAPDEQAALRTGEQVPDVARAWLLAQPPCASR